MNWTTVREGKEVRTWLSSFIGMLDNAIRTMAAIFAATAGGGEGKS